MPRGTRHYERHKASCPRCAGENIAITGPTVLTKGGIEKAPVRCRTCGRVWLSENTAILALVPANQRIA